MTPKANTDRTNAQIDTTRLARQIKTKGPAPVHLWDPPFCGDMDMQIRRDGTWIHEGKPIRRKAMRKLFASILKIEDGEHYLVTPHEKVRIQVEDCPFLVNQMEVMQVGGEQCIQFTTDLDEQFILDGSHALSVEEGSEDQQPHPIVHVRGGLQALISRNVFYRLVDMAVRQPAPSNDEIGVISKGQFFLLGHC